VVLVNSRWLPPAGVAEALPAAPSVGLADGEVAYVALRPQDLPRVGGETMDACLADWKETLPVHEAGGRLLRFLWELIDANGNEVTRDWEAAGVPGACPAGLAVVGPADRVWVDPSAQLDPLVVADTTGGPVVVGPGAVVAAFTRLEGPCFVGPGTHVLGAKVRAGTSLGPQCRVGGEVEASVMLGHSNKYHEGFLGHAYVGAWVNLGAGTHNSDLRNDYGDVTVRVNGRPVNTGRTKVGCFLGDHTKAALGTLLNTGTSAGAFCNLLPTGGLLPRYAPSFTAVWNGTLVDNADLEALLSTAATVMQRRGRALTPAHAALYRGLCERTAAERRRAVREAEQRRLRRSA
jgi:UDP-N-acetylglucosamine diphosphorylase/glucosamine-1-phosphate N-acetyltransferase